MRGINSATVDLIYLDPPFNSKANYAAPIGSKAAGAAFKDTWTLSDLDIEWLDLIESKHPALQRVIMAAMTDGDKSYLVYMAIRLLEMRRILKSTGSIYLHCDPTMSHYLKLVMDAIFGKNNFRNEIVWQRVTSTASSKARARRFPTDHDTILVYGNPASFTMQYRPYDLEYIRRNYKYDDGDGRGPYTLSELASATKERVTELERDGRLVRRPNAKSHRYKNYLKDKKGVPVNDIWADVAPIASGAKERTGYPTQKPLALLERIIKASSNEGDMVFDPFCGCATTCVAADALDREWAGIDISEKAYELVNLRLRERQGARYYEDGSKQASFLEDVIHRKDIPQRTDLGKLPKYNSEENKRSLYGTQAGDCASCKEHFAIRHFEVDHIVARSKGGSDHISNLQLLCGHCNRVKGNRGMEYLRQRLRLAA